MNKILDILSFLYQQSNKCPENRWMIFWKSLFFKFRYQKYLFVHPKTYLTGIENIQIKKVLHIGTVGHELNHPNDVTKISVNGSLKITSEHYFIGRGCRIDVAEKAELRIGKGGFINPFTNIIVRNGVEIGNNCLISWNCQILDEDFHTVSYPDKKIKEKKIVIGDHVWIGSGTSVYQGTKIADGCVIAANSVVRGIFTQPNCIIGGNPARVIKENISWHE